MGGAIGIILMSLIVCLLCHRKLRRRVQTGHLDDLRHRIDERHRCYHNENLLQHHHHFHHHHHQHQHQYQQQQQQQQHYQDLTSDSRYHLESSTSPMSESDVEEASSLNSV